MSPCAIGIGDRCRGYITICLSSPTRTPMHPLLARPRVISWPSYGSVFESIPQGGLQMTAGKWISLIFKMFVARRARVQWPQLPIVPTTASILTHVPPRWAYKAPTTSESAVRYLTCPEQPFEGLAYVGAVAAVVERQASARGHRRLPMRTISLNDGSVRQVFDEAHALAEWVVNYDDLLDPEQLRHQNVRVIRYQKDRSNGRNVVVSSTSRSRVLEVLLRRRLEELGLGLTREKTDELIAKLIGAATDISGEIVLRASKRGTAAGELIGIVLSAALVREEFGAAPVACFFLDDYAAWLGQSESGIADLLFISFDPTEPSKIRVVVTEAKYVGSASVSDSSKKSRRQVEATVGRINDALFENPGAWTGTFGSRAYRICCLMR